MSAGRARFGLALRLARREVRRHPWRHALVVAMIFLPVLATVAAFSGLPTFQDYQQRQDRYHGYDDRTVPMGSTSGPDAVDPTRFTRSMVGGLPEGTEIELHWEGGDWLVTRTARPDGDGPLLAPAQAIEATEGSIGAQRFVVEQGRLPRADGEALLTRTLADAGDWRIGDEVTTARTGEEFEVVGIGVTGDRTDRPAIALAGRSDEEWGQRLGTIDLVDLGPSGVVSTLAARRMAVTLPDDVQVAGAPWDELDDDADIDRRVAPSLTMGGAAICALVAVVASAAFAISSRRQLRSVGLLASAGTDPRTIRTALVLQGAIPGLVAGLLAVGTAVAVAAWANGSGIVAERTHQAGARIVLSPGGMAIGVLLGIGAGAMAAWQPARTASRIPTLSALAGRRPVGPVSRRVPLGGLLLWGIGLAMVAIAFGADESGLASTLLPFLLIGGTLALVLGGVGLAPALVAGIGRLADRARGIGRLALRGLARHRLQSSATVAAVGVALALPIGVLTSRAVLTAETVGATTVTNDGELSGEPSPVLRDDPTPARVGIGGALRSPEAQQLLSEVLDVLGPDATTIRSFSIVDGNGDWRRVAVVDEDEARSLFTPWAADAIEAGQAIVLDQQTDVAPSTVSFTAVGETVELPAIGGPSANFTYLDGVDAQVLVGVDAMEGVGEGKPTDSLLVVRSEPTTPEEDLALDLLSGYRSGSPDRAVPTLAAVEAAVAAEVPEPDPDAEVWVDRYFDHREDVGTYGSGEAASRWDRAFAALVVATTLLSLGILAVTLSLRSVDSSDDRHAALAAGLPPAKLRHQRAWEGVVLTSLGAALALPLGWLPVMAARFGSWEGSDRIDAPPLLDRLASPGWLTIPVLVVPVLLAGLLWWAVPALADGVRRARRKGPVDQLAPRW